MPEGFSGFIHIFLTFADSQTSVYIMDNYGGSGYQGGRKHSTGCEYIVMPFFEWNGLINSFGDVQPDMIQHDPDSSLSRETRIKEIITSTKEVIKET